MGTEDNRVPTEESAIAMEPSPVQPMTLDLARERFHVAEICTGLQELQEVLPL